MDMKTIYLVWYDWAINGSTGTGYYGIYENLEDAIKCMEHWWGEEKTSKHFQSYDVFDDTKWTRSAWKDYEYSSYHSEIMVFEEQLYSHEDVLNGEDR
jgi:hypothetical protein